VAEATIAATTAGAAAVAKSMPYNIPLNGWKIIFQAILTTINVVCWLVPLKSKSFGENKLALSLANAFSGGVFLSLAFGHLIPECVEGFASSSIGHYNEVAPYMLVLSGYLLIFFVEKVAFDAEGILHEMEQGGEAAPTQQQQQNGKAVAATKPAAEAAPRNTSRSAVILLGALAVHSILEMMALGLSDSFSDSAILTISIALHQVRLLQA
jgi:zinc transporter 1/2/3